MPLIDFGGLIQTAAQQSDAASQETRSGKVTNTYFDSLGNVVSCDVRCPGQQKDIVQVPNLTGTKFNVGDQITLNFSRGSKHQPQIIQSGGASAVTASLNQNASIAGFNTLYSTPDLSGVPLLTVSPSSVLSDDYVIEPVVIFISISQTRLWVLVVIPLLDH